MRIYICILAFLMTLGGFGHVALAQSDGGSGNDSANAVEISSEKLDDLITTLESETARTEFLDKLKTLANTQEEEEEGESLVDLSDTTGGLINSYEKFVADLGISEGLFAQIASTCGILVLWALFIFINRKLAHILRDRLLRLRDKYELSHDRFRLYARYIRYVGYTIITALSLYTVAVVWDVTTGDLSLSDTGQVVLVTILNIVLVTFVAIIIWEVVNTAIENYIRKLDSSHSNRMLTLIPIVRNVFFVAFFIMFALVLLSEVGVNVTPLLAGAGVLGIAIGLGGQTMIKDFITGFTIILEDLIQVGDVANVGGKIGLVEKLTIRKVQLRDLSGIVYTVPFSEISIVENWTKEFSFYVMDIGVAYRENTDEVIEYLKEIDEEMRNDEDFKDLILEPLEIMGVDAFADSAVIIKARIKTQPIKQWTVGREFNRRMKYKFDEKGVEIPFPHQTLYFGEDKNGKAPAAPIKILGQDDDKESDQSKPKKQIKRKKKSNTEDAIGESK